MRMPWLVCCETADGRWTKCYACGKRYEAEQGAAYLNRFGEGRFRVMQGQ